ncbi:MAG: polysaccharide deacetylase family protein [Mycobacteriales bacterium]
MTRLATAMAHAPVVLAGAGLLASAGHAVPAVTTWPWLRRTVSASLHGERDGTTVAVTFDDGPHPEATPLLLDLLRDLDVPATFFVLGQNVARWPDVARRIAGEGHEVAVHGWTHRNHLRLAPSTVVAEDRRTAALVTDVCGVRPRLARPPYGVVTAGDLAAARAIGLRLLLWTAWGRDWEERATPATILGRLDPGLRAGSTLLLHDSDCTSAPNSWRATLAAVPEVVRRVRAAGGDLVTASTHLAG